MVLTFVNTTLRYRQYSSGWLVSAANLQTYPGDVDTVVEPIEITEVGKEVSLDEHTTGVKHWARISALGVNEWMRQSIY